MRSVYTISFAITAGILLGCLWNLEKSKAHLAKPMQKIIMVAMYEVLIHVALINSNNVIFSTVLYGLFYAVMDWLLYFLFAFIMIFVGNKLEDYVKLPWMYALLAADSVLTFLGGILGYSFYCQKTFLLSDGSMYIIPKHLPVFHVHIAICYMLFTFTLIALVYKLFQTPSYAGKKYWVVLGMLLMMSIMDTIYMLTNINIDISVLSYAISALIVCYYALVYEPRHLTNYTYRMVLSEMADGVILLDITGKPVKANKSAYRMFDIKEELFQSVEVPDFWTDPDKMKMHNGKSLEWSRVVDGQTQYFESIFQCLEDKKGHFIGGFFTIRDLTQEKEQRKIEHYRAAHDALTGIYNREHFFEKVKKQLEYHPDEDYILICSDIKDFKFVNDVFGTEAGDKVLIRIAELIEKGAKRGEVYGRIENDRFGFLMKKKDFDPEIFSEGPREKIYVDEDNSFLINIYVGIYEIQDRTIPVSIMCDRAYLAIKSIKNSYQQKVAYYTKEMREDVIREQELSEELDKAIEEGQIQIYLQPQITGDGHVPGAEALVRWQHPTKGMIMPGDFIEIFEKNGMIVKLDQYIWGLACKQLKAWKDAGITDKYISVNISPKDFYLTDIYKNFTELVAKYEIEPPNLKLEITETAIIMDLEHQLLLIDKLRKAGFVVEMDDFGSGYSSLNMLKDIHVDVLKIDMAFLRHSANEERSRKILKMMIELSQSLEMFSITEGVETEEQKKFLEEVGCNMYQGYYFAKPMPVKEFEEKYMDL